MRMIGLVLGGIVGLMLDRERWLVTALTGAAIGWLASRIDSLSIELNELRHRPSAQADSAIGDAYDGSVRKTVMAAVKPMGTAPTGKPVQEDRLFAAPNEEDALGPHEGALTMGSSDALPRPDGNIDTLAIRSSKTAPGDSTTAYGSGWTRWFLGGNVVVRVGMIVLFFGVAFLLRYAYDHTQIPVEVRLATAASCAIALLVIGWRLRHRTRGYAHTLQGGGIGLLYLTIYVALRLYGVLPSAPSFILMFLVALSCGILAVVQDSLALALLGVSGGFLAPILASTGTGSHISLFSYYVVLNLGIVGITASKAWRSLNRVGFVATSFIACAWGVSVYRSDLWGTTEAFLAIFFLIYVSIPLLYARHQVQKCVPYLDAPLVFGVPVVVFGFQAALVNRLPFGVACSALAFGGFYVSAAWLSWRRFGNQLRIVSEAFLALGLGFATLAIPLAFDAQSTSATWSLEGAALVWAGDRLNRSGTRIAGYCLQLLAGLALYEHSTRAWGAIAVLNSNYVGSILLAASAWFSSAHLSRNGSRLHRVGAYMPAVLLSWGFAWWVGGGVAEIRMFLPHRYLVHAVLAYLACTAAGLAILCRTASWPVARYATYALTPTMVLVLAIDYATLGHPFSVAGYLAWPIALALHVFNLHRVDGEDPSIQRLAHLLGLWILCIVVTWESSWQVGLVTSEHGVWSLIVSGLAPLGFLCLLQSPRARTHWPISHHPRSYLVAGVIPIATFLVAWIPWVSFASDGDPTPMPYLPFLNPLDLSIGLVLVGLAHCFARFRKSEFEGIVGKDGVPLYALFGLLCFIGANGMLLRTLHWWALVPFQFDAMWRSVLVQAALSLSWTLIAVGIMMSAKSIASRGLWIGGAVLIAGVVAKLFLVDLSNIAGVERIVSFIGVGVLMLVIGYFAPVPPRPVVASDGRT